MGPGGGSPGIKRPGLEADQSPPSSAEIENAWMYTSIHQYVFMAWCLVKYRDNFTFTCRESSVQNETADLVLTPSG
jgi:hypothetical protein